MFTYFGIGIDSSIGLTKNEYYFSYKGTEFKLVPGFKKGDTDSLVGCFPSSNDLTSAYKLMGEFLSCIAFYHDSKIIMHPGISTNFPVKINWTKMNLSFSKNRSIPVQEIYDGFYFVPYVENDVQITAIRLYRQALASNNPYLTFLFYWHILVFPGKNDYQAILFINERVNTIPAWLQSEYQAIIETALFSIRSKKIEDFGKYVKNGIKHSLSHIVRNDSARNIELDLLKEEQHIGSINKILKFMCKEKMKEAFKIGDIINHESYYSFSPES